jgi:hypothetical protein
MTAPFRIRPEAQGGVLKVNEDPKRLDEAYIKMLGPGGDKVLGDEVKWLAVTHKSFEHGKRGFNDRLAYLGMVNNCSEPTTQDANDRCRTKDNRAANITGPHSFTTTKPVAKEREEPATP